MVIGGVTMKLKQLIEEWLYENHQNEIKRRTLLRYECSCRNHIFPQYGEIDIEAITPRDIQHWINVIKEKPSHIKGKTLSPSTINNVIAIFRQAFNYAEEFEIIDNNPARKIKRLPQKSENKIKAFTREEQIKLEKYIYDSSNTDYFVYILVLYTGLRLGEAMGLTWSDINLRNGVMTISKAKYKTVDEKGKWVYVIDTPKTDKSSREIPLPPFLREELRILKKEKHSKYVISRSNGEELTDKTVVWRLKWIEKKIKIRTLNFHCLRHTFATRALENKMDIKTLSDILGHSNVTTTLNIYTHSLINHKKSQMRKIKRLSSI